MLLTPLTPHLSHELCQKINKKFYWPESNINLLEDDTCQIVIQVDGKKRGIIEMPVNSNEKTVIENSKKIDNILKYINGKEIIKNIYIKNKLLNFILKK